MYAWVQTLLLVNCFLVGLQKNKNNVALYARVSTKDKGQDTENQLKRLRTWCKKNKYTIAAHEYIDKESGRKANRTQFKQLFIDARQGKFDLVCSGLLIVSAVKASAYPLLPTAT